MNEETYVKLLTLVTPLIEKQETVMRNAISAHERLTATLRFLATGRSYQCLKFSTIISPQALGRIIPETCAAIYEVLKKDFIPFPDTSAKWKQIAEHFEERWNFPHCLGAIDGKHIDIIPPADSGSYYYNYKGRHSMVLMAIVDARYRFILADFGTNGRVSDGGVLQNTKFFKKLQNKKLNIPNPENIESSSRCLPYVFVTDDAFPLRADMLKPYRQADLNNYEKKIFNYRLSRARRIVENAFGILSSRFRIYHTKINIEPDKIQNVVMATIGRISDGGVFTNSILWNKICTNSLNLPPPQPLPGSNIDVPYVFLGDGAFALSEHLMKPYPGQHNIGSAERKFNTRLSSGRVVVENTFGILAARFRVFRKPIPLQPEKASLITYTCILLHNFLRRSSTSSQIYTPPGSIDLYDDDGVLIQPGSWRTNQDNNSAFRNLRTVPRRPANNAVEIRKEFTKYLSNI
ncbi:hypothetical protein evm_007586 [Chilo suppressalis]|nr:hypothetical protein evm_007586 [Chilo suppressalis]